MSGASPVWDVEWPLISPVMVHLRILTSRLDELSGVVLAL